MLAAVPKMNLTATGIAACTAIYRFRIRRSAAIRRFAAAEPFFIFARPFDLRRARLRGAAVFFAFLRRRAADFFPPFRPARWKSA